MLLRDVTIGKSQEELEIEKLMSGESGKTPDILNSEIEILVEEMTNDILSVETACKDLETEYNDELLHKYEKLTGESAISNYLVDNWLEVGANIIDRIIAFIKKLFSSIMTNLKKFYVKFLVLFNKQKEIAINLKERFLKNKDKVQDRISTDMVMFINEYGYLDAEVYNNLFNSVTLNNIVNRLKEVNRNILLSIPNKAVYKDIVSDGKGPLNDMVNQYEEILFNTYNKVFFKDNRDTNITLNKNIVLTDISNIYRLPFILCSNGIKSNVLDISERGLFRLSTTNVVTNSNKKVMNIDVIINIIDDLYKYELKKVVEGDFKLLDLVKKDSEGYLNQAKRYNKVDTYGISVYANNVTTTLNFILNYCINRMEISENILKLFKGL